MSLASKIEVNTRYTRSVNLERDSQVTTDSKLSYILTSKAKQTLERVADTFTAKKTPRVWSLVGPYGSGKSSFALYLSQLLGNPKSNITQQAFSLLQEQDPALSKQFEKEFAKSQGYLTVLISGTPERLTLRYLKGLLQSMRDYWANQLGKKPKVISTMEQLLDNPSSVNIASLLNCSQLCQEALAKTNCPGILVVLDELGKFLEYAATNTQENDIFLLQALAENSLTDSKTKFLLFVLMHQSMNQYARGTNESLRNEWTKIQGRFEEIIFQETTEQSLKVVGLALTHKGKASVKKAISKKSKEVAEVLLNEGGVLKSTPMQEIQKIFDAVYPLHPLSAVILPNLCQLLAQNERTLFTYLSSNEPHGLKWQLQHLKDGEYITPEHIFDYFIVHQTALSGDALTQKRWAEVVTSIERCHNASKGEIALLKTIGLLNIVGNAAGIRANLPLLSCLDSSKIENKCLSLQKKSAIVFRKFNNEYRVWQGSDLDIDQQVNRYLGKMGPISISEEIHNSIAISPIVARKYSIKTGTLRYFQPVYVDATNYQQAIRTKPCIFIFLASRKDEEKTFRDIACAELSQFGLTTMIQTNEVMGQVVLERLALETLSREEESLNNDPVAQKEVSVRISNVSNIEKSSVQRPFSHPEQFKWWYKGEEKCIQGRKGLQNKLSEILENAYTASPVINNELINRNKPSTQATGARKKLLSKMLTSSHQENLGIDKFPPERAIYLSVLKETGLHKRKGSQWLFSNPSETESLYPVWQRLEEFLSATKNEPQSFSSVNAELLEPPYGVKAGILPVLWLAVYLVHEHELALYEDGNYIPGFDEERLERFVKRPDLFAVQLFQLEGINKTLFREYQTLVSSKKKTKSVLDVAKALVNFFSSLPEHTLQTKRGLSSRAMAVRDAFELARTPQHLLLKALPEALHFDLEKINVSPKEARDFSNTLQEAFRELQDAHPRLINALKNRLAQSFHLDASIDVNEMMHQCQRKTQGLEHYASCDENLRGFLFRVNTANPSGEQWLENILMYLGKKPSTKWSDADYDTADLKLSNMTHRIDEVLKMAMEEFNSCADAEDHDVLLLKSTSKYKGPTDLVVTVDSNIRAATNHLKEKVLAELQKQDDHTLQSIVLAQVVDEFLRQG